MCESHSRRVNKDRRNIPIVLSPGYLKTDLYTECNSENKQSVPCSFNKFLKHSNNSKGTQTKKYLDFKYKLAIDILLQYMEFKNKFKRWTE